ncbi:MULTISPECIES: DUF2510 domain-containing protein [unclassified Microbacterium]|uniref:DUF2510 domain-containing protein n=1 Tax=unclassified Microbacterium TaxID=2609290 RepID=UPI00300FBC16
MATPPPGWYDDGHGAVRWWDGRQWTEHVASPASAADDTSEPPAPHAPERSDRDAVPVPPPAGEGAGALTGVGGFTPPRATEWSAPSGAVGGAPDGYGYSPAAPAADSSPVPSPVVTYPGDATSAGASSAPQKSKGWLVWLLVGVGLVAVLAAVVALAVMLITGGFGGPATSPASDPAPRPQPQATASVDPEVVETEEAAPTVPADAAAAATAAVETYNQAWLDSDCEAYIASTTERFRTVTELPDCESFYPESRNFAAQVSDFQMTVREVQTIGDAIAVSTTESFISPYDDEGNPTAEPQLYEDPWEYFVVYEGDAWKVNDLYPD